MNFWELLACILSPKDPWGPPTLLLANIYLPSPDYGMCTSYHKSKSLLMTGKCNQLARFRRMGWRLTNLTFQNTLLEKINVRLPLQDWSRTLSWRITLQKGVSTTTNIHIKERFSIPSQNNWWRSLSLKVRQWRLKGVTTSNVKTAEFPKEHELKEAYTIKGTGDIFTTQKKWIYKLLYKELKIIILREQTTQNQNNSKQNMTFNRDKSNRSFRDEGWNKWIEICSRISRRLDQAENPCIRKHVGNCLVRGRKTFKNSKESFGELWETIHILGVRKRREKDRKFI